MTLRQMLSKQDQGLEIEWYLSLQVGYNQLKAIGDCAF